MTPTIYVITYHKFNHDLSRKGAKPLDKRFLESDKNYIYYLIDSEIPEPLKDKQVLLEKDIDPVLYEAGAKHFGEWSFLLAEEKHSFCTYPFFMISSRFYEKNLWLKTDLNQEWDKLFSYFNECNFGWLPSYDRPLRWIDFNWKNNAMKNKFFPFNEKTFQLIDNTVGVNIPDEYRYSSDLFCNYIGFKTREDLLDYINYYKPLINALFDSQYKPKCDINTFVKSTGFFRNEKPFTFILEMISHTYFFQKKIEFFALHYKGYYKIQEHKKQILLISKLKLRFKDHLKQFIEWRLKKFKSEGLFPKIKYFIKPYVLKFLK